MWVGREPLDPDERPSVAHSRWWSANAADYLAEHGDVLGEADFVWGPEGLEESEAEVLGDPSELRGSRILEIGAGAAQCSRYLAGLGARVVATDVSLGMLAEAASINASASAKAPLVAADGLRLPFAEGSFDVVFTSFGVVPFVENLEALFAGVARVLVPGGVFAYSAPHPARWMFPDSPTKRDMTVTTSYFSSAPYVERGDDGELVYVECHHTLSEHMNALAAAGFAIERVWEPEWPKGRDVVWGGWGPERSPWIPGTLIVRAKRKCQ